MEIQDFSHGFDTLLNSYAVAAGFGSTDNPATIELDEYEKSVFLTKAQKDLAIDLYSGRNPIGASFEETEELRRYLSPLVEERTLSPIPTTNGKPLGVDSKSKFFTLPEDLWFITYESVILSDGKCGENTQMEVVPVRQDEYHRIKKNPFRGANDRRALRLDLSEGNIEIVSKYTVASYYLRYLRKLKPIILVNLDEENAIEGRIAVSNSELPESLHQMILDRAVTLAAQSRGYTRNNENK
jgi:hypothetical protein